MTKFNVGDLVEVVSNVDAFDHTLPVGSISQVRAVYPNRHCRVGEILLGGNDVYHLEKNIRAVERDPLLDIKNAVAALRADGWDVEVTLSKSETISL